MNSSFTFGNMFNEEQFDLPHYESPPQACESVTWSLEIENEEQFKKLGELTVKDFKPLSQELEPNLDSWESAEELDSFEAKESGRDCQALYYIPKVDTQVEPEQVFSLTVEKKEEVSTKACSTETKPSDALKESLEDEIKVKMCLDRKDVVIKR